MCLEEKFFKRIMYVQRRSVKLRYTKKKKKKKKKHKTDFLCLSYLKVPFAIPQPDNGRLLLMQFSP